MLTLNEVMSNVSVDLYSDEFDYDGLERQIHDIVESTCGTASELDRQDLVKKSFGYAALRRFLGPNEN